MAIFGHRKCYGEVSDKTGVPEGYRDPPGELMGLMGLSGEERGPARRWRTPPLANPNWTRGGGGAPPFPLLLPLPFPLYYSGNKEKGGVESY